MESCLGTHPLRWLTPGEELLYIKGRGAKSSKVASVAFWCLFSKNHQRSSWAWVPVTLPSVKQMHCKYVAFILRKCRRVSEGI